MGRCGPILPLRRKVPELSDGFLQPVTVRNWRRPDEADTNIAMQHAMLQGAAHAGDAPTEAPFFFWMEVV